MNTVDDSKESPRSGMKPILGVAAAACVACCIGPILAVLGAIAALGVLSTILIGAAGLIIAAAAIAAFVTVRRRKYASFAVAKEPVPVEFTTRPR